MAQQRGSVTLDRAQRRAQLVRDGTQQLRLHPIDLLERRDVARFVEQLQVVDRERRVIGQRHQQALIRGRPGAGHAAFEVHHTDHTPLEHHRHGQLRGIALGLLGVLVPIQPGAGRLARHERAHRLRRRPQRARDAHRPIASGDPQCAADFVAQPDRAGHVVEALLQDRHQLADDLHARKRGVGRLRELVQRGELFETSPLKRVLVSVVERHRHLRRQQLCLGQLAGTVRGRIARVDARQHPLHASAMDHRHGQQRLGMQQDVEEAVAGIGRGYVQHDLGGGSAGDASRQ